MKKYDTRWMAARAWYTAGRTVDYKCPRCGANGMTMPDKCRAPLDDACPGFMRNEEVHKEFEENWQQMVAADEDAY